MPERNTTLAIAEYRGRQERDIHPDGSFDKAGRWYPSDKEYQECCNHIRPPSRKYPNSLNRHCRSIKHIIRLFGLTEKQAKQFRKTVSKSKEIRARERLDGKRGEAK